MARLSAAERRALPDRAFAYVDSSGKRRLPIADAAHVRNALARFGRVEFESDAARDAARARLLRAARRYRIVPVGFIDAEVRTIRRSSDGRRCEPPTGFVTLLMTDIEGSTPLLAELGDAYASLLDRVNSLQVDAIESAGGHVVEVRADELFAAFRSPADAVRAAIGVQRRFADAKWSTERPVRVRIGVHAGYPTVRNDNYVGMVVNTTARIADAAHGGQILVSGDTRESMKGLEVDGVRFRSQGAHRLRGVPGEIEISQVHAVGLATSFPPLRLSK